MTRESITEETPPRGTRATRATAEGEARPTGWRVWRWRWPQWRIALGTIAAAALLASPWWGRVALSQLAFFHVRRLEIVGVRYLSPSDLIAQLHVDTMTSVWTDLAPLEERIAKSPGVAGVAVERDLPGTIRVIVTERIPVALVPTPGGFRAYDGQGTPLPADPSRVAVDAPVVPARDSALFALLDRVRSDEPALFARISEVRRGSAGEIALRLPDVMVRAMPDVTVARLTDIFPVEDDLAKRNLRVAEIDLRFRDQVIARLQ